MNQPDHEQKIASTHKGPNPGRLALAFTLLFNAGLYFVVSFSAGRPPFPGPWDSADVITTYFQNHPNDVLMCAFLQFGSAIPVGLFTASIVGFWALRLQGPTLRYLAASCWPSIRPYPRLCFG